MPCVPRPVQMRGAKDGRAVQRKTTKARTRAARANAFTHAHARTYTRTRTHAPAHTLAPAHEPHGDVDGRALENRSSVARQVTLVEGDDDDDWASKERPPKLTQARSGATGGSMWDAAHGVAGRVACRNSCPPWGPLRARRNATLCRSIVHAGSRHAVAPCSRAMQDAACSMRDAAYNVLRLASCMLCRACTLGRACRTLHRASCMQRYARGMPCHGG